MNEISTVAGLLRWANDYLVCRKVPSPYIDAEYILAQILGCRRNDLLIYPDRILTQPQIEQFNASIERRGRREPLQYITGEVEFRGLMFKVNADVLIPRPETELLVDEVVNIINKKTVTVLDLCTGSGCIAVSIAKELTEGSVYAVDISEGAVTVARENALRNQVEERITFLTGDLFRATDKINLKGRIDIIVSNPPYVSAEEMEELQPEIRDYEPASALFGGEDGLDFYRSIIRESPLYLAPGGSVILEMGYGQAGRIRELFDREERFRNIRIEKDLAGIERIIMAIFKCS
ncbi:MAG: peptide chain release factor N(5)-glutamine methyltransferase [Nitrospirae bacterium]|nr:peptide chain release factor N(5)-glutamine methyltransferase [Nitrospirota bacterium]